MFKYYLGDISSAINRWDQICCKKKKNVAKFYVRPKGLGRAADSEQSLGRTSPGEPQEEEGRCCLE